MSYRLGFIGLGVMGYPMAGHLQRAGHQLTVYNRTATKAETWVAEYGGHCVSTPREVGQGSDVVFCCVGNDDDLRSVCLGDDGVLTGMSEDGLLIDHTTTSAIVAREIADVAAQKQIGFLDAPVSGGQAGAQSGQLSIMVGGNETQFTKALTLLNVYAKAVTLIGEVGSGQLCKMVNQICIAGLVQGLSEALNFADKADLDIDKVISVISKGAAQSWQMENRWQTMVAGEYEHGFAVDWMRKDLSIALQQANVNGSSLPVTALVDQFYANIQAMGGNRWDTSSLLARLKLFN